MREESLVTAVHDCADVSGVCEEECGTWGRSVLFCHQNWFEVIDTLGKCSILPVVRSYNSPANLRSVFTAVYAQSTLDLHCSLRYRNSGRRTVLEFPENTYHVVIFENSAQNHKIVRLPAVRERRL